MGCFQLLQMMLRWMAIDEYLKYSKWKVANLKTICPLVYVQWWQKNLKDNNTLRYFNESSWVLWIFFSFSLSVLSNVAGYESPWQLGYKYFLHICSSRKHCHISRMPIFSCLGLTFLNGPRIIRLTQFCFQPLGEEQRRETLYLCCPCCC